MDTLQDSLQETVTYKDEELPPGKASHGFWAQVEHLMILGFHPSYYAAVMGTGLSGNLLHGFPFPAQWLKVCGLILAMLLAIIFAVLNTFFVVALVRVPDLWWRIHCDPACAPYMGCFVMGATTLVLCLHTVLGPHHPIAVWVLWWLVSFLSVYTATITFYLSLLGKHRLRASTVDTLTLSLTLLLPVVTLTVSAAVGGLVAEELPTTRDQIITMVVSLVMWGAAMTTALAILAVNFWRMFVHRVPHSGQVFTLFLPIGFVGQGAYAILLFGANCTRLLLQHSTETGASDYVSYLAAQAKLAGVDTAGLLLTLASALMVVCALVAILLMACGYMLTAIAVFGLFSKVRPFAKKYNASFTHRPDGTPSVFDGLLRFHRGFWSMTFPIGTMALANNEMYRLWNGLGVFRWLGALYTLYIVVVTLGCLAGVLYRLAKMFRRARHPGPEEV